jgi:hypothetical protein
VLHLQADAHLPLQEEPVPEAVLRLLCQRHLLQRLRVRRLPKRGGKHTGEAMLCVMLDAALLWFAFASACTRQIGVNCVAETLRQTRR